MNLQAVTTTRTYCRSDCNALPHPSHTRPLRNAVEALADGYRPCLKCRPDRLPFLALGPQSDLVASALRQIAKGALIQQTLPEFARGLKASASQLSRVFKEDLGAKPEFVSRAHSADLGRRMLDETSLLLTDIAGLSGFSSAHQMSRIMRTMFGLSPSQLRAKRCATDLLPIDEGLRIRVPYVGALASNRMMASLKARAIPGVETMVGGAYRRAIHGPEKPACLEVAPPSKPRMST